MNHAKNTTCSTILVATGGADIVYNDTPAALSTCEADIATMLHTDEPDPEDLGALKNLPSKELTDNPSQGGNLSESLKTVPIDTRNMLDQLFRAEYKAITPITPEELIKL